MILLNYGSCNADYWLLLYDLNPASACCSTTENLQGTLADIPQNGELRGRGWSTYVIARRSKVIVVEVAAGNMVTAGIDGIDHFF